MVGAYLIGPSSSGGGDFAAVSMADFRETGGCSWLQGQVTKQDTVKPTRCSRQLSGCGRCSQADDHQICNSLCFPTRYKVQTCVFPYLCLNILIRFGCMYQCCLTMEIFDVFLWFHVITGSNGRGRQTGDIC